MLFHNLQVWTLILVFLPTIISGQVQSSLFQCQPSSGLNGNVFIPNIPNLYFSSLNAAQFHTGSMANLTIGEDRTAYIFSIPPQSAERNCSATVRSIQFCYIASTGDVIVGDNIGNSLDLFNFLTFTQSGSHLSVNGSTSIRSVPSSSRCSPISPFDHVCCDTRSLGNVYIPSSSFMFGIAVTSNPLVAFSNSASEFRVTQHQTVSGFDARSLSEVGTTFLLNELRETVAPLLLLRLHAEPDVAITTEPMTGEVPTLPDTTVPVPPDPELPTNSPTAITSEPTAPETELPTNSATVIISVPTAPETRDRTTDINNHKVPIIIGGVSAALILLLLVTALALIILVLVARKKAKRKSFTHMSIIPQNNDKKKDFQKQQIEMTAICTPIYQQPHHSSAMKLIPNLAYNTSDLHEANNEISCNPVYEADMKITPDLSYNAIDTPYHEYTKITPNLAYNTTSSSKCKNVDHSQRNSSVHKDVTLTPNVSYNTTSRSQSCEHGQDVTLTPNVSYNTTSRSQSCEHGQPLSSPVHEDITLTPNVSYNTSHSQSCEHGQPLSSPVHEDVTLTPNVSYNTTSHSQSCQPSSSPVHEDVALTPNVSYNTTSHKYNNHTLTRPSSIPLQENMRIIQNKAYNIHSSTQDVNLTQNQAYNIHSHTRDVNLTQNQAYNIHSRTRDYRDVDLTQNQAYNIHSRTRDVNLTQNQAYNMHSRNVSVTGHPNQPHSKAIPAETSRSCSTGTDCGSDNENQQPYHAYYYINP